ncbi:unnamed protein product, partial [Larinioides sclopetarius]
MKFVVLHLSFLVACVYGAHAQGFTGKLEEIKLAAKAAEAKSLEELKAVPQARSEELLGFGCEGLSCVGKDLSLGYGFSNEGHIDGLSDVSGFDLGHG